MKCGCLLETKPEDDNRGTVKGVHPEKHDESTLNTKAEHVWENDVSSTSVQRGGRLLTPARRDQSRLLSAQDGFILIMGIAFVACVGVVSFVLHNVYKNPNREEPYWCLIIIGLPCLLYAFGAYAAMALMLAFRGRATDWVSWTLRIFVGVVSTSFCIGAVRVLYMGWTWLALCTLAVGLAGFGPIIVPIIVASSNHRSV